MKVFYLGRSINHHIHIQPANNFPNVSAWREHDGRPKSFDIHFVNGEADIEDNIAEYLVDQGLASKTKNKIITSLSEVV